MIRTASKLLMPLMVLALSPGGVAAADGETLYNKRACASCHGKDGKTPIMPGYPYIAGQDREYVLQQMKDIKSGARANGQSAAMKGVMGLVTDEEMSAIADYVATMTP